MADWELWCRFVKEGRGARCQRVLVEYLQHPGSMLFDREVDIHHEFRHLRRQHPDFDFDPTVVTHWSASRYRLEGRRWGASRVYLREAWDLKKPSSILRAAVVPFGEGPMRRARGIRRKMKGARGEDVPDTTERAKVESCDQPGPS
jgi:hypothetical protein